MKINRPSGVKNADSGPLRDVRNREIPVKISAAELDDLRRRADGRSLSGWVRERLGLPQVLRGRPLRTGRDLV
jgi:hypothetical protein